MSRCIREETTPLFYETVVQPDMERLKQDLGNGFDLSVYRFTKYVGASESVSVYLLGLS